MAGRGRDDWLLNLRHLQTRFLWIQERVRKKDLMVRKTDGKSKPADVGTRNLGALGGMFERV